MQIQQNTYACKIKIIEGLIRSRKSNIFKLFKPKPSSFLKVQIDNHEEIHTPIIHNTYRPKFNLDLESEVNSESVLFVSFVMHPDEQLVSILRKPLWPLIQMNQLNKPISLSIDLDPGSPEMESLYNCFLTISFTFKSLLTIPESLPPTDSDPLPIGWESRRDKSGKIYYVDHNSKTTQWERPQHGQNKRIQSDRSDAPSIFHSTSTISENTASNQIFRRNLPASMFTYTDQLLGPLREGWERALVGKDNRLCFIDHNLKRTSYDDPRVEFLTDKYCRLPIGYEFRIGPDGVPYFANHPLRTTTFIDPRSGLHIFLPTAEMCNFKHSTHTLFTIFKRSCVNSVLHGPLKLNVSRENMFQSSFAEIMHHNSYSLHKRLFIFIRGEVGLDYGGVSREFFLLVSRDMVNPNYGLFQYTSSESKVTVQINPYSNINEDHLLYFRFVGRFLGLALFHNMLIDASFDASFYKQLLQIKCGLKDIMNMDEQLHSSLSWILKDNIDDCDMELYFSVDDDALGTIQTYDLIPGGRDVAVTNKNKHLYVELITQWRVTKNTHDQMLNIKIGFYEIIPPPWVQYFNEKQLEMLLCGVQKYDLKDWKHNTKYTKGYTSDHKVIKWFWEIVESLSIEEQALLLQFATGTCKIPIGGFSQLHGSNGVQLFTIMLWDVKDHLPQSHTCFNRIDLPPYESYAELKEKLIMSITESTGFLQE